MFSSTVYVAVYKIIEYTPNPFFKTILELLIFPVLKFNFTYI